MLYKYLLEVKSELSSTCCNIWSYTNQRLREDAIIGLSMCLSRLMQPLWHSLDIDPRWTLVWRGGSMVTAILLLRRRAIRTNHSGVKLLRLKLFWRMLTCFVADK